MKDLLKDLTAFVQAITELLATYRESPPEVRKDVRDLVEAGIRYTDLAIKHDVI